MSVATTEPRMSTEEFLAKYGDCSGVELIRGRVVWKGRDSSNGGGARMPNFKHGVISQRVGSMLLQFVTANDLGWVASNDTFVPVGKDGDSVLGPDVLYVSYKKVPKGKPPADLLVVPELVVEVRSPSERWGDLFGKVGEYLNAGVSVVLLFDPHTESASVHRQDELQQVLHNGDELTLPDVLPGFAVPVRKFFE